MTPAESAMMPWSQVSFVSGQLLQAFKQSEILLGGIRIADLVETLGLAATIPPHLSGHEPLEVWGRTRMCNGLAICVSHGVTIQSS